MARNLTDPAPSSAVSRLFDPSLAGQATARLARPEAGERANVSVTAVAAPPPVRHIKRECILTPSTDAVLSRLTEAIRRGTGARVNTSNAVRAMLRVVNAAWPRVEDELRAIGPLRLPGNGPGSEPRREAFEEQLAAAIGRAVRTAHADRGGTE